MNYLPVLDVRPDFKSLSAGQLDDFTYVSQGLGRSTPWKVTAGPKRTITAEFLFGTHADAGTFRLFCQARHGRRRGFWLPIPLNEYRVAADAGAGATEITVERSSLTEATAAFSSFQHLHLATWDKLECYEIDSVEVSGEQEIITLTSALASDLVANQTVCGGLLWVRLSDDLITFRHQNDMVCRVTVKFLELPTEYVTEHTGSAPVYLYEFSRGAETWRYANFGVDLEAGGQEWGAADITHSAIVSGIEALSQQVQIRLGTDLAQHPARYFTDRLNQEKTTVSIYRTDYDTLALDTSAPLFRGQVERVAYESAGVVELSVSSLFRIGEFQAPTIQMQRLCNNRLFDGRCGLAAGTFTTSGTITGLDGSQALPYVEADEFGAKATAESDPNWFALGRVTVGQEVRLCVGQDGDRLYLNAPFRSASIDDAITATAGCDKRIGTCDQKFSNVARFLGFPYLPNTNPNLDGLMQPKPSGGKKA